MASFGQNMAASGGGDGGGVTNIIQNIQTCLDIQIQMTINAEAKDMTEISFMFIQNIKGTTLLVRSPLLIILQTTIITVVCGVLSVLQTLGRRLT